MGSADMKPFPEVMSLYMDTTTLLKLYYHGIPHHEPAAFRLQGDSVYFEVRQENLHAEFFGVLQGDSVLLGNLQVADMRYPASFVRTASVELSELGPMIGFFQLGERHLVQIEPFSLDGVVNPLMLIDYTTGKKRVAFPLQRTDSTLVFSAGAKMLSPFPEELRLVYHTSGTRDGMLQLCDRGLQPEQGGRMPDLLDQRDVSVEHGGITLHGTVTYPHLRTSKVPLVVYVPGEGGQARGSLFDEYIRLLPYYGVATLVYDKRGNGLSTGSKHALFEEQADDLLAILQTLEQDKRIDKTRVGAIGLGQAGMVMAIAATKGHALRFMTCLSSSFESIEEQEYKAIAKRLRADGFSEMEIAEALAYQKALFSYLKGGLPASQLQEMSDQALMKPWNMYVTLLDDRMAVDAWRQVYSFSPTTYWEHVQVPVHFIYGERDLVVDASHNAALATDWAKRRPGSQVDTYPGANHLLMLGERRGDFQLSEMEGYPPMLFERLHRWIATQAGLLQE